MRPDPETVEINDLTMAYNQFGSGEPPLVLVHGFTGSRFDFRAVIDELAADRRVVVVDQRGHGNTTNPIDPTSYSFDQLVADLTGFLDEVIAGPFHLLGHSMGGMVCMRYAIEQPENLASLILMDTSAESPQMPFDLETDFIERLFAAAEEEGLGVAREMNNAIEGDERKLVDEVRGPEFFADDETWRYSQLDRYAVSRLGPTTFRHNSILDACRKIAVPTTVLCGTLDTAFYEPCEAIASTVPDSQFFAIDGAYHSPQHTHAADWLAIIRTHFAAIA